MTEEKQEQGQIVEKDYAEGFPITGEEVENSEEKSFEIIGKPYYKRFEHEGQVKEKMVIPIQFNGSPVEWIANRTSQSELVKKLGRNLEKWKGFNGKLKAESQKIGKENRKVVYLDA